ncbi:MAG: DMT family transporter [Nitrospinota bacterium]
MIPVLLALGFTLSFSSAFVLARRGILYCNIILGSLIATCVNLFVLTVWVAATAPLSAILDGRILIFFALGLFVPSISRTLLLVAVQKVGASRSASLRAMSPLLASLMAVAFLGERPTTLNVVGMLGVITGGVLLSRRGRKEKEWRRRDLIYPLAGTFLLGIRDVVIRYGVADHPHPAVGAWAAVLVSVFVVGAYWLWVRTPGEGIPPLGGWVYFGLLGVVLGVGFVMLFLAYQTGRVVIISPISGATPLFTLLFSAIFLRDLERLNLPLLAGCLCIVLGGALVALQL